MNTNYFNKVRTKLNKKLREQFFDATYALFNSIPKSATNARGLVILVYHGICETQPYRFNSRFITAKQFEDHLKLIKKIYHPVSMQDVIHNNLSHEKLNVLITFDDGLKNNYTYAFPLLKQYHIPAVFFATGLASTDLPYLFNDLTDVLPIKVNKPVTIYEKVYARKKIFLNYRLINQQHEGLAQTHHSSSYADRNAILNELLSYVPLSVIESYKVYYELMAEKELKEISNDPAYEIACHGFYHTDLSCITEHDLENELKKSIGYLHAVTGKPVNAIAFPYGNYNQQVINACESHQLNYLFGTEKIFPVTSGKKIYERFTINPFVSAINQMYYIAKHNYE